MSDTSDMSSVIIAKSDQINAVDLVGCPRTITVTKVAIRPGTEQPVAISFEGNDDKVYRPCKGMARVLVAAWGPDAKAYVGRSMTLYLDPKVRWAGLEVGGIRISHLSHIERDLVIALAESKQVRKPFTVKPLRQEPQPPSERPAESASAPTEPEATTAAGSAKEWTPADAEKRGKEIAAILRDHDNSAANLSWSWQQNEDEIRSMPGPAQRGLRKVYETEMAAIERTVADEAAGTDGRVEDERQKEMLP